jgi:hypothetical protein
MPIVDVPAATWSAEKRAAEMAAINNNCLHTIRSRLLQAYRDWWMLEILTKDQVQAALDVMTPAVYLPILDTARQRIEDIKADFGDAWDAAEYDKYLTGPYEYTIDPVTMRMELGNLRTAWQSEVPQ